MREDGWITKAEAAALLDCDERTIERKARAGKIASKQRPGFPTLYLQAAVEILRQAGRGEVQTGILETGPANGTGNATGLTYPNRVGGRDLDKLTTDDTDPIRQLAAAFRAFLLAPIGPTGPTIAPTGPTARYVAKAEALAIAGVSDHELRRAVKEGEVKVRGRRYRRKDLEAL